MTKFAKRGLIYIHASDFPTLMRHNFICKQAIKLKLSGIVIKPGTERNGTESIGARVTQVSLNRLYISMISMILPIYLRCSIRNISLFSNYSRNM